MKRRVPLLSTWTQFATEDRKRGLHNLCLIRSYFSNELLLFKIQNVNYQMKLREATIFMDTVLKGEEERMTRRSKEDLRLNFNLDCKMESAD